MFCFARIASRREDISSAVGSGRAGALIGSATSLPSWSSSPTTPTIAANWHRRRYVVIPTNACAVVGSGTSIVVLRLSSPKYRCVPTPRMPPTPKTD